MTGSTWSPRGGNNMRQIKGRPGATNTKPPKSSFKLSRLTKNVRILQRKKSRRPRSDRGRLRGPYAPYKKQDRSYGLCVCGEHAWAALTDGYVTLVSPEDAHHLQGRKWSAKKNK